VTCKPLFRLSIKSLYNFKNLLQRLDYFLWGYVKDIVNRTKVRDISNLKQRIIEYRHDVLRVTNGAHIQVYEMRQKETSIYVSFCNNFPLFIFSFAFVINFLNCRETLWTPCIHNYTLFLFSPLDLFTYNLLTRTGKQTAQTNNIQHKTDATTHTTKRWKIS
jgi:hypothetical protein